jgi:hypothetical protein
VVRGEAVPGFSSRKPSPNRHLKSLLSTACCPSSKRLHGKPSKTHPENPEKRQKREIRNFVDDYIADEASVELSNRLNRISDYRQVHADDRG